VIEELGPRAGTWKSVGMTLLACHQVRIDDNDIAQVDGATTVARVPRAQVRSLRVRFERPSGALIGGSMAVALLACLSNLMMAVKGASLPWGLLGVVGTLGCLVLVPLTSRRMGFVLAVETAEATRRLRFGGRAKPDEIRAFADAARTAGVPMELEGKPF
jgi:hypothetical protein